MLVPAQQVVATTDERQLGAAAGRYVPAAWLQPAAEQGG